MPKRSLMLAGGGLKIAFQAGVLQVWLDEAGIEFDHADGVSAACFNLALWAQGKSGREIADEWRRFRPLSAVSLRFSRLLLPGAPFSLDAFRRKIFPQWGLDFEKIRAGGRDATFNVYNFSRHELWPVESRRLTEDLLIAAGSLSAFFPPVEVEGETVIDAVFMTAANLEAAIARGADEIWVIWTTSRRGIWKESILGGFFGLFEATTNHAYKAVTARIAASNAALERGEAGEFGRPILLRELAAEVPIHYLFSFRRGLYPAAVEQGVEAARAWCRASGVPLRAG
jgi:predicted acylesterase/phospholipase RssA